MMRYRYSNKLITLTQMFEHYSALIMQTPRDSKTHRDARRLYKAYAKAINALADEITKMLEMAP